MWEGVRTRSPHRRSRGQACPEPALNERPPTRVHYARAAYDEAEIAAVVEVLREQPLELVAGPRVRSFEARVAALLGHAHGVMVNSGSSANLLALAALDLPPGSEVLTPALTFATTVAPIVQLGLVPVFVDVAPGALTIDVERAADLVGPETRAALVPDLIGHVADWPALRALADAHDLRLVEDGADTLGPTWDGAPTGRFADLTTTSFYASHLVTCAGTGGLVAARDPDLADRARLLRAWGRRSSLRCESDAAVDRLGVELDGIPYDAKYVFDALGYNLLPTEVGAAFGLVQLDRLEGFVAARKANARRLSEALCRWPFWELPTMAEAADGPWHALPLLVRPDAPFDRPALQAHLEAAGIQTRTVLTGNVLRQPALAGVARREDPAGYPEADRIMRDGLLLGCHQTLSERELDRMIAAVDAFAGRW